MESGDGGKLLSLSEWNAYARCVEAARSKHLAKQS